MSTNHYPYTIMGFKIEEKYLTKKTIQNVNLCKCNPQFDNSSFSYCPHCGQYLRAQKVKEEAVFKNFEESKEGWGRFIFNDEFDAIRDISYGNYIYIGKVIECPINTDGGEEIFDINLWTVLIEELTKKIRLILDDLKIPYTFGIWTTTVIDS